MINTLKALIVVLPVIILTFATARFVFAPIIRPARMDLWCGLFSIVTILGFVLANFWFMILALLIFMGAVVGLRVEKNLPALYALLICVLPPLEKAIPGFAGINQIFPISPPLLLSITILIPALLYTKQTFGKLRGIYLTDFFMFAFVVLSMILAFRDTTFTDGLRAIWIVVLSVFLPYFIFSRWVRTMDDLRVVAVALLVPLIAMSVLAFLESVLHWHFYAMPSANWHGPFASPYSYRSGFLRAYASVMGPIEFGFMLMVVLTLTFALLGQKVSKIMATGGIGAILGALLLTFSRGPWLGAVISTGMYVVSGPKGISRGMIAGVAGLIAFIGLAISPMGDSVLSILPFFGDNVASDTFDYRERLWELGWRVIMQNPLFGSTDYLETPEMKSLIQGQGIVDIVNSYIQVALDKGLVGLFLFCGILLSSAFAAWRAMRLTLKSRPALSDLARAFFAAMMGVLVVIGTTSSIAQVPIFYWMLAGLSVGARRLAATPQEATSPALAKADGEGAPAQNPAAQTEAETGANAHAPEHSLKAAQQAAELDGEARALAKRNAQMKARAGRGTGGVSPDKLPAHLRQYVKPDAD